MNILVLGGTGFLGRHIVEQLLEKQYPVTVLTRNLQNLDVFSKKVSYVIGDLLKYKEIDFSNYTHIINCSGELNKEELMYALHIDCIKGILAKLKKTPNVHWIQISSVGVYGKVRSGEVVENTLFAPIGPYEITKSEGELLVKRFCLEHQINYTIIRPSNVFGVGMPNQSLAQLISMFKRKLFFYIGRDSANIVMNYVPVEDVALLTSMCINNQSSLNQEFIISDQLLLKDFVQIVCEELKIEDGFYKIPESLVRLIALCTSFIPRVPLTQARVDALTMRVKYSTEKARVTLQYSPIVGSALGLRNYISYCNNLV